MDITSEEKVWEPRSQKAGLVGFNASCSDSRLSLGVQELEVFNTLLCVW